ncbi:MAG: APC family permease [Sulfolobaceae archaeon]|nr:APC family permease [Sulfolobaceae archaeon]
MGETRGLFIRETSGLVREISPWASLTATFGLVTGGIPIIIVSWLYLAPGANWTLAYLITLLPVLALAFLFFVGGASMPRSGGDYVFNTRAVHPLIGYMNYFGLFIGFALSLGYYSYLAAQWFGYLFSGIGLYYNSSFLINLGNFFSSVEGSLIVGTIVVILSAGLAMLPRAQWKFVLYSGIITLITTIIMYIALWKITPTVFANTLAHFTGVPNAYSQVISDAEKNGLTFVSPIYGAMLAVPVVWYYYSWYNLPASWAGELRKARYNLLLSIIVGIIIIAIYYMSFTYFILRSFGQQFLVSWSYITANGINDTVYNQLSSIGPFIPFFGLLVLHSLPLYIIMFIALWLPNFYSNPPLVTGLVRYLFAWSFDRIMPEWMADVNERFRAPIKATIVVTLLGELGLLAYAYNTAISIVDVTVIFQISYAIFALSAALMPYLRKDLFKNVVIVKRKILGIPVLTWIGSATFAFLLWSLIYTWGNPVLLPINLPTILSLVIIYGVGLGIYIIAREVRKRRLGIDINLVFREIPPE